MPRPSSDPASDTRKAVNLRVPGNPLTLIDRAAQLLGRTRSDFMIEASRRAAEEAILDQTVILTDHASFDRFVELLDRPPQPNERLRKTMQTPALWEHQ